MRREVLEDVARLERENDALRAKIHRARAREALEETVRTRAAAPNAPRATVVRVAAAISFGLAFGLVTLAVTLLLLPPVPGGYHPAENRGGSAGVCR